MFANIFLIFSTITQKTINYKSTCPELSSHADKTAIFEVPTQRHKNKRKKNRKLSKASSHAGKTLFLEIQKTDTFVKIELSYR